MRKLMAFGLAGFILTSLFAMHLYGALTQTTVNGDDRRMRTSRATSTGAMAEALSPAATYKLHYVMVHYSGAASTNSFTVTLDSGSGAAYDVLLHSTTLSSTTDIIFQPTNPYTFLNGDEIDVASDDQTTTWSVVYLWEELR